MGTSQKPPAGIPKSLPGKTSGHRVPALDAICRKSSQDVPNDFPRLNCPSTAAWYRWDCPIPMCCPTYYLFYAAYSIIISEKLQCLSAAHRDFFRLKKMGSCATIFPPFGETGANPVRARRRNVQSTVIILTRSRVSGKRHWSNSEKAD